MGTSRTLCDMEVMACCDDSKNELIQDYHKNKLYIQSTVYTQCDKMLKVREQSMPLHRKENSI